MLVAKNATPEATIAALTIPKDLPDDLSTASAPVEGGGNSRAERGAGRIGTIVRSGTAEGSDSTETSDAKPPNPCGISVSELLFITGPSANPVFQLLHHGAAASGGVSTSGYKSFDQGREEIPRNCLCCAVAAYGRIGPASVHQACRKPEPLILSGSPVVAPPGA
jgi:hypothetical protein